jgi:hypothetical protein
VLRALWRARPLVLGLIALGLAYSGQHILVERGGGGVIDATRWYVLGIVVMLLAWIGTYKNKSLIYPALRAHSTLPVRKSRITPPARHDGTDGGSTDAPRPAPNLFVRFLTPIRYTAALGGAVLSILGAFLLRSDYHSLLYGLIWAAGLAILALAFTGYRAVSAPLWNADRREVDVEDRTDWRLPRRSELIVLACILLVAAIMRLYRLDDWYMGMHGDEGEFGDIGVRILAGEAISPFTVGLQGHPNATFWGLALSMKVFGTDIDGLRMFPVICGMLLMLPFYGLVKMWFGLRMAIIATLLVAISDVHIHFSRLGLDNIVTPLALTGGFYFFFRGLRTGRMLSFVLSGYVFTLGLYFYAASRLTPIMLVIVFAYLLLLLPLLRLPDAYRQARAEGDPGRRGGRGIALLRAVRSQFGSGLRYTAPLVVFFVASVCFISPLGIYYLDNPTSIQTRSDAFIFRIPNYGEYIGETHDPLYVGLRMPRAEDVIPVLPVVFERTPTSVMLAPDGMWPRVLWRQLNATLSIITYRSDTNAFYGPRSPIARPFEAVLIVLGLAWAVLRWRDARMGVLLIWFWLIIVVGGALTSEPPYMARLVGIIPATSIFAALPLNKLAAELTALSMRVRLPRLRDETVRRASQVALGAALVALLGLLTYQNFINYYVSYPAHFLNPKSLGQAIFVREMNERAARDGREPPEFLSAGIQGNVTVFWYHGTNRFLNRGVPGRDMYNLSHDLPLLNKTGRDVVFMLWGNNVRYLAPIKALYPNGEVGEFQFGPNVEPYNEMTYYIVRKEEIEARRFVAATYRTLAEGGGEPIARREPSVGKSTETPDTISYPAEATWAGGLVVPTFGKYRFQLSDRSEATFIVDGQHVLTGTTRTAEVTLGRGLHRIMLSGILDDEKDELTLLWDAGSAQASMQPIDAMHLDSLSGTGLYAEIRQTEGIDFDIADPMPDWESYPLIYGTVGGFLSYASLTDAMASVGAPIVSFTGRWVGRLQVSQANDYRFDLASDGSSALFVDDRLVVSYPDGNSTDAALSGNTGNVIGLTSGTYRLEIRYRWRGGGSNIEAYWTPPNGQPSLIGPEAGMGEGIVWSHEEPLDEEP